MEQLRPVELKLVDELFGMCSGYVLDFNNRTFADFFRREVGIDIYDNAYAINGGSKGKHLRAFLTIGQPRAITRALGALWEYRETDRLGRGEAEMVANAHRRLSAIGSGSAAPPCRPTSLLPLLPKRSRRPKAADPKRRRRKSGTPHLRKNGKPFKVRQSAHGSKNRNLRFR
jgi:hypothetical protein